MDHRLRALIFGLAVREGIGVEDLMLEFGELATKDQIKSIVWKANARAHEAHVKRMRDNWWKWQGVA